MKQEFQMRMIGELKFFLVIQIQQKHNGVLIRQSKYTNEFLKKFNMNECKPMITPMHRTCSLDKDDSRNKVD